MTSTAPNSSSRAPPRPPPSISVSDSSNAVKSVSTSAGSDVARGGPLGIAIPQRQSPDPQSVHSSEDEWSKRTQAAVAASLSAPKLFSTRRGDIDDLLSKLYSEFKNDNREENVFGDMRRYADELAAASVTVVPVGSDGASGERSRVSTESDNRGDPSASSSSPRPAAAIRKRLRRIHCAEGDSEEEEEGGDDHGEEEETSVSAVAAAVSPPHKPPLVSVAAAPATPRDRHGTTAPRCQSYEFHQRFVDLIDECRDAARTELVGVAEVANTLGGKVSQLSRDITARAKPIVWAWLWERAKATSTKDSARSVVASSATTLLHPAATNVDAASPMASRTGPVAPFVSPGGFRGGESTVGPLDSSFMLRPIDLSHLHKVSDVTVVDLEMGLVYQRWGGASEAAKRYVKCLSRFANASVNVFHTPFVSLMEVCGVTVSVATLVPLATIITNPTTVPEVCYFVEAATAEQLFAVSKEGFSKQTLFGSGRDARMYCLNAYGLYDRVYSATALTLFEGEELSEVAIDDHLRSAVPRVATELTAMARGTFLDIAHALQRHGLRVANVMDLHILLSIKERVREKTLGCSEDKSLIAAIVSTIAEALARILKFILRAYFFRHHVALLVAGQGREEQVARSMAAFAHQVVRALVIDHPTRPLPEHQLASVLIGLIKDRFPVTRLACAPSGSSANESIPPSFDTGIWELPFVSIPHVAKRLSHMLGLFYASNAVCGITAFRSVRATTLSVKPHALDVFRGKHQETMQRLNQQFRVCMKLMGASSSPPPPPRVGGSYSGGSSGGRRFTQAFYIGVGVADLFHLAHGRQGVTRTPEQVYEMIQKAFQPRAVMAEGLGGEEAVAAICEHETKRVLALQALALVKHAQAKAASTAAKATASCLSGTVGSGPFPSMILSPVASMLSGPASPSQPSPINAATIVVSPDASASTMPKSTLPPGGNAAAGLRARTPVGLRSNLAVAAFKSFFEKNAAIVKATQSVHVRNLLVAQRVQLMKLAADILPIVNRGDLLIYLDVCFESLQAARRGGLAAVDVTVAMYLWTALFTAKMELQRAAATTATTAQSGPSNNGDIVAAATTRPAALSAAEDKMRFVCEEFGPESIQAAVCENDVALVFLTSPSPTKEDLQQAKRHFERAFSLLQTAAPQASVTLLTANNLAVTYARMAQFDLGGVDGLRKRLRRLHAPFPISVSEALDHADRALSYVLAATATRANVQLYSDALNNSGWIEMLKGKYGRAASMFEKSLVATRGYLNDEHPDRASTIKNFKVCQRRAQERSCLWLSTLIRRYLARRRVAKVRTAHSKMPLVQQVGRGFKIRWMLHRQWHTGRLRAANPFSPALHVPPPKAGTGDNASAPDARPPPTGPPPPPVVFHAVSALFAEDDEEDSPTDDQEDRLRFDKRIAASVAFIQRMGRGHAARTAVGAIVALKNVSPASPKAEAAKRRGVIRRKA